MVASVSVGVDSAVQCYQLLCPISKRASLFLAASRTVLNGF